MKVKKARDEEFFTRNSELSMEFSRYVLEHPEMDDVLKDDKIIIFIPEFDSELKEFNEKMAKEIEDGGGEVVYIKVKELSPKITSRLVGVEVGSHD